MRRPPVLSSFFSFITNKLIYWLSLSDNLLEEMQFAVIVCVVLLRYTRMQAGRHGDYCCRASLYVHFSSSWGFGEHRPEPAWSKPEPPTYIKMADSPPLPATAQTLVLVLLNCLLYIGWHTGWYCYTSNEITLIWFIHNINCILFSWIEKF